jgi:hypothetical protein
MKDFSTARSTSDSTPAIADLLQQCAKSGYSGSSTSTPDLSRPGSDFFVQRDMVQRCQVIYGKVVGRPHPEPIHGAARRRNGELLMRGRIHP